MNDRDAMVAIRAVLWRYSTAQHCSAGLMLSTINEIVGIHDGWDGTGDEGEPKRYALNFCSNCGSRFDCEECAEPR